MVPRALISCLCWLAMPVVAAATCERPPGASSTVPQGLNRGWQEIDAGRPRQAEAQALSLLEEIEGSRAVSQFLRATVVDLLVESRLEAGRFTAPDLRRHAEEAVSLWRGLEDVPRLAASLTRLGALERALGDTGRGERLLVEALALVEAEAVDCPRLLTRILWNLIGVAEDQRRPEEARNHAERAHAVARIHFDTPSPEAARALAGLAVAASLRRDWGATRDLAEQTLEMRRQVRPPSHPEIASSLRLLAHAHAGRGDPVLAGRYAREAIAVLEAHHPDHPELGAAFNALALEAQRTGDYLAARWYYERALRLWEAAYGSEHSRIAGLENNLGNLHKLLGDLERAERHLRRSLALREHHYGESHPLVAQALTNLGGVYHQWRRLDEAEPMLRRALAIREHSDGPESVPTALALNNLGTTLRAAGRLEEAEEALTRALEIYAAVEPQRHLAAAPLNNIALVHQRSGDLSAARQSWQKAADLWRNRFGPEHPRRAVFLDNLAWLELEAGDTDAAFALSLRAEELTRDHLRLTARGLSEREALTFARSRVRGLSPALVLASEGKLDDGQRAALWDALIRSRSLVLDEMASRQRAAGDQDPAVRRTHESLEAAAATLARLLVRGPGPDGDRFAEKISAARRALEQEERAFAAASNRGRRDIERARASLEQVAAALPAGTALIAFERYLARGNAAVPEEKSAHYIAWVLVPGETAAGVRVVPLGRARDLEPLVARWLAEAGRSDPAVGTAAALAAYRAAGEALRRAVWDPIAPFLESLSRVWLVPDGDLHLVSFAALPSSPNTYLLETGPLVQLLTRESDLLGEPSPSPGTGLLALGGVDFEAGADPLETSAPLGADRPAVTDTQTRNPLRSPCEAFPTLRFAALPHSAEEVLEVASIWAASRGSAGSPRQGEALTRTGAAASEAAFKRLAPGSAALHLATHGFFLSGGCLPSPAGVRGVGGLAPARHQPVVPPAVADHPLRLSGLALAGANRRREAADEAEDGILTAEEIAVMDLSSVEWAVLSACSTGVGEIDAAEGVFGLRRAFQIAGVRTLVTSLWSVDDRATGEWMAALYRGWLEEGLSPAEAVRHASLGVLQARRERGESDHPFYWAAFVAVGH